MFYFPEAARILGATLRLPNLSVFISGASIDTRILSEGNLFVALRGEKSDGHCYLKEAFLKGASGAIVDRDFVDENLEKLASSEAPYRNLIPVSDPAEAFRELAAAYRLRFDLKVVGITGSVGKTSTKEFLRYILSHKYSVLATEGNLNNHLGLPLTLFGLRSIHQACVAELGANHMGEIRGLAGVLKPDHAILTRIAPCHLEGFGSLDNIYKAKLELFEALRAGSSGVIPDDDPVLFSRSRRSGLHLVRAGFSPDAEGRVSEVRVSDSRVRFKFKGREFSFPGLAGFLAVNAAMALAMAEILGLECFDLPQEWDDLKLPGGRFEETAVEGGIRLIYDGYNASPASFEAALDTFAKLDTEGRKILVFADMLELGDEEEKLHEELGRKISRSGIDVAVAYGKLAKFAADVIRKEKKDVRVECFENPGDAAGYLKRTLRQGDVVLLKASRGMKIEEVLKGVGGPGGLKPR